MRVTLTTSEHAFFTEEGAPIVKPQALKTGSRFLCGGRLYVVVVRHYSKQSGVSIEAEPVRLDALFDTVYEGNVYGVIAVCDTKGFKEYLLDYLGRLIWVPATECLEASWAAGR